MSGIFLAYSRADRELAYLLVRRLRGLGVEVWWDEDMPGVDWQDELARKALELAGVLVLWTPNSTASRHVKDEARLARENDKLINVVAGVPQPPFPYDAVNGLPLDGWTGREPHNGWSRTVQTVEDLLVHAGAAKPGQVTGALRRRDADILTRQAALATAQAALQDAQDAEAGAADTAVEAAAAFERAQAQHRMVVDQGLGPLVIEGARQELEAARAANDGAKQAVREAKSALSRASRAAAQANRDLERGVDGPEEGQPATEAAATPVARIDPPVDPAPTAPHEEPRAPATASAATKPAPAATGTPTPPPQSPKPAAGRRIIGAVAAVLLVGLVGVTVANMQQANADRAAEANYAVADSSVASDASSSDLSSNPQEIKAMSELSAADAADASGDHQTAATDYEAAEGDFPGADTRHSGEALNGAAWSLHLLGSDVKAFPYANLAVQVLTPLNDYDLANALETRAEIEEKLGSTSNAITDYRATLASNPGNNARTGANAGLARLGATS
jgi:hypothetical protein